MKPSPVATEADLSWQRETVWTCRVHDGPPPDEYDEDGELETWDWPEPGCSCRTARWKPTGRKVLVYTPPFARLLKELYLPVVVEQLNAEILGGLSELSEHPPR